MTRTEYATTTEQALSGVGGLHDAGRWHSLGNRIIYTAQSSTLCLLERLVHADEWIAERRPNRVMLQLTLPTMSWTHFTAPELTAYDPNWRLEGSRLCRRLGDLWLSQRETCALMIPSASNPSDFNVLFNPEHCDFKLMMEANNPLRAETVDLDERIVSLARARRSLKG